MSDGVAGTNNQLVDTTLTGVGVTPSTNVSTGESSYDKASKQSAAQLPTQTISKLLSAYQSGEMPPEDRAQFEKDIAAGLIILPSHIAIGGETTKARQGAIELPKEVADAYNKAAADPYTQGLMSVDERKQLDADLKSGLVKLPSGVILNQTYPSMTDKLIEGVTGSQRQTDATRNLPEMMDSGAGGLFAGSDVNPAKAALAATAIATATDPQEIAKILTSTNPDIGIAQDEKGNLIAANNRTGVQVIINKPGMSKMDLLQGVGLLAAYTPAARATTIAGAAAKSGLTEAAIQGSHGAAGGTFDPTAVGEAALIGGAVPGVGRVIEMAAAPVKGVVDRALGRATASPVAAVDATIAKAGTEDAAATAHPTAPAAPTPGAPVTSEGVTRKPDYNSATQGSIRNYVVGRGEGLSTEQLPNGNWAVRDVFIMDESKQGKGLAQKMYVRALEDGPLQERPELRGAEALRAVERLIDKGVIERFEYKGNSMLRLKEVPPAPAAAAPIAPAVAAPARLSAEELAQTARKASADSLGSAKAKVDLIGETAVSPKILEAAKRLGIEDYMQVDHLTTNQAFRELSQGIKSIPGSEAHAQEIAGLRSVAQRADNLITEIGGTHDISMLSSDVKSSLTATQKELEARANKLYDELRANIPAQAPAEAPSVLGFIKQRAEDLGGIQNLSPMEKMISSKLSPKATVVQANTLAQDVANKAMNGGKVTREEAKAYLKDRFSKGSATTTTKQPTYALLDDVRRDLTAARIKGQGPFKDADTGLIKKLEMELKKDQAVIVDKFGMKDTFEAAQNAVRVRKGIEDDLSSLFGKSIDGSMSQAMATAVKALPGGDPTKLINLINTIPADMRKEVVASGLATAFGKNARSGNISFNSYAKWYEGLLTNKQSYHALMANLPPEARKQLSDLYRVSKGISLATRERITTGRIQAIKDEFQGTDGLMSDIYSLAKRSMAGAAIEAVTTPIGLPGAGLAAGIASALAKGKTSAIKAADTLIASPEFSAAAKLSAAGNQPKAATTLAYSRPFIKFARSVGNPREMSSKEQWIMRALEANSNNNSNSK